MEETTNKKAIELTEGLVDVKIEAEELLKNQNELLEDYDEFIKRCNNILNS